MDNRLLYCPVCGKPHYGDVLTMKVYNCPYCDTRNRVVLKRLGIGTEPDVYRIYPVYIFSSVDEALNEISR